jgi:predicted nuclease with TOPRIM domain
LKDDLEDIRRESKNIEKENSNLRKANESLVKDLKKKTEQLNEAQTQEIKIQYNLKEIKKLNENLIEDIKILNDKLYAFVPDSTHKENEELKETLEVIDIYKQAEIDAENHHGGRGGSEDTPVNSYLFEKQIQLKCNLCSFTTESKRGLSVHIERMHAENQNGNNLITF